MSDSPKLTPTFNDNKEVKASQPSMILPKEESKVVLQNLTPVLRITPAHEPIPDEPWMPYDAEELKPGVKAGDPMPEPKKKRGRPKKQPEAQVTVSPNNPPVIDPMPDCPCEGEDILRPAPTLPLPKWLQDADIGPEGKVALIGTAPSSRLLAPFHDDSWRIWACSPGNMGHILPKVHVWFEIHSTLTWPENQGYGMPYLKWLSEQKYPVFMQDIDENRVHVPNFTPYPVNEMIREFGPFFFTSSFAWMLALAMVRGAKQIALFGIDMASRDEYILQRPGAYYFFMEAQRRGISIGAPSESDIMQPPPPYGFFETSSFGRKICAREKELKDRLGPMRSERDKLSMNITYLEGALEDIDYVKNIWGGAQLFGQGQNQRLAVIPGSK